MLDNIIEKYGLDAVSKETKISKQNLEKLLKKDFSSFSKPRALGFISILEREYKEDFSDIKEYIVEWFQSQNEKQPTHVAFPPPKKEKSRHWIAIIPLAMVMVFGFYLYQNEFANTELAIDKSIAMKRVEKVYKDQDKQKLDNSKKEIEKSDVNSSLASSDEHKEEVTKVVTKDKNESSIKDIVKTESSVKKSDGNTTLSPYVPAENIVLYPDRKMWIGVVNLKNKKRNSRMITKSFIIEPDVERLIITGHGFFSVSDTDGNNLKFSDPSKHYFLLKEGVIKEIDVKEFKNLNGGRVW